MKSIYEKPFAEKVEFRFEKQVVAASGDYPGSEGNRDDTDVCQWQRGTGCNIIQYSKTRWLYDCDQPIG